MAQIFNFFLGIQDTDQVYIIISPKNLIGAIL